MCGCQAHMFAEQPPEESRIFATGAVAYMDTPPGPSWPSDQALAFGERYAEVLAGWSALFAAASELVTANVTLGRAATDSAKEFDQWLRQNAAAPWTWMRPEALQQFADLFRPPGQRPE